MNAGRSVCLCGSTKFIDTFKAIERAMALAGWRVHSVSIDGKAGDAAPISAGQKLILDGVHMHKILACDEVHVVNETGYVGESTMREIAFALTAGIPVTLLEGTLRTRGQEERYEPMSAAVDVHGRYVVNDPDELLAWIGDYEGPRDEAKAAG